MVMTVMATTINVQMAVGADATSSTVVVAQ